MWSRFATCLSLSGRFGNLPHESTIMSDTDKLQPETTPAAPAEPPKASPPPPGPQRAGKKFSQHTGGGRVRRLDPVPSLEDDLRFGAKPNLRDLDAEIE